ncbi:MAG: hypothetical protein GX130_11820 [Candidatus Hydrogenedens sp.]|nr:hypothetical protein [Candidatus Hydrogenedens sp.]
MDTSTIVAFLHTVAAQAETAEATQGMITGMDLRVIVACISAAVVMALAAVATGWSEGVATGKAVESIGRNPESAAGVTRALVIGLAITEAVAIYALLVAAMILFMVVN